jgi:hypothetical protein
MACFIAKRVGLGFPSFAAKIGEGAMAGGERGIITVVAWK